MTSHSFTELPPFYEPGAPPPTLPILIAQTELGGYQVPSKLLAQQEIYSMVPHSRWANSRFSPYPKPDLDRHRTHSTPSHQHTSNQRSERVAHVAWRRPSTSRSSPRSNRGRSVTPQRHSTSSESDNEEDSDEDRFIPKPEGEAGRPGRGGYNLEEKLGWDKKQYERLKNHIKKSIQEHLDTSKSFASQSETSLAVVKDLAIHKFPVLSNYAQAWPAFDLIRLQLKYMSGRARLQDTQAAAVVGKTRLTRSRKEF